MATKEYLVSLLNKTIVLSETFGVFLTPNTSHSGDMFMGNLLQLIQNASASHQHKMFEWVLQFFFVVNRLFLGPEEQQHLVVLVGQYINMLLNEMSQEQSQC